MEVIFECYNWRGWYLVFWILCALIKEEKSGKSGRGRPQENVSYAVWKCWASADFYIKECLISILLVFFVLQIEVLCMSFLVRRCQKRLAFHDRPRISGLYFLHLSKWHSSFMLLRFKGMLTRSIITNTLCMHMCIYMSIFAYRHAYLNTYSHTHHTLMHSLDKDS